MELRTLETATLPQITATFNEAFSDYVIPLQFSEEGMRNKIKAENILLQYSVGAFEGDQLIGFVLHGYDIIDGAKTIYNAGTGVIPSARGKRITAHLYSYIIPVLARADIYSHLLEVIDDNKVAAGIYTRTGFEKVRQLGAFKGSVTRSSKTSIDIKAIDEATWDAATGFMDFTPSWQNSTASIRRSIDDHVLIGAYLVGKVVGYAVYISSTGRIRQFAVEAGSRRKGVGSALFSHIASHCETDQLTIINVDDAHEATVAFLQSSGLNRILGLTEMKMLVPNLHGV